ncbi:hypothetical protein B0T24DRAFT_683525 [Lasiosphaeria ovina]|uniref:Uncharacterized protein n=1 Tax=Lasiosphaeria ovina TaxID=92902 RepID=A0AAE0JV78_9PEZI|nr:hypothetical protein B0T24DRAFT_683525 [Lasiosphaeria ovina]
MGKDPLDRPFQWILDVVEKKPSEGSGRGMFPTRVAEEIVAVVEGRSREAQFSSKARIGGILVSVGKPREDSPGSGRIRHSRVSPLYRSDHPFAPLGLVMGGHILSPKRL